MFCLRQRIVHVSFRIIDQQWRSNTLWATKRQPKTAVDTALEYFDSVYGPLFEKEWPSIRLALLSPHKYCALVNNFCDADKICIELQNEGGINIKEMFDVQYKINRREKKKKLKKAKEPEKIYNVEAQIEKLIEKQKEEEWQRVYPEGAERTSGTSSTTTREDGVKDSVDSELLKKAKSPLERSLADATIDYDRQIEPIEGLSSSRLSDFVPATKLKGKEGFVSEAEHFEFYNETKDFPITVEAEESLDFPSHLKIYTFEQGNISYFTPPKTDLTNLMGYYLMDASSILPVLALGLRPGDKVLDMCASPGGKTLVALQTLYPDVMVCNDSSLSRVYKLRHVMQEYLGNWQDKVTITNLPGQDIKDMNTYSKILVDAPCTNDRHSVMEPDNNIFKSSRNRERIMLPQLQVDLLFNALNIVKPGGSVVYSTCSLNPAQNDGVVQMALRRIWEETNWKIVVKDLGEALEQAKVVFKFAAPHCLRYGSLVVPYLPANFGPMYFCKLEKREE